MIQTIKIKGMSCAHCAQRVKKALESIKSVKNVQVDLVTKQAQLTVDQPIAVSLLQEIINQIGYQVI